LSIGELIELLEEYILRHNLQINYLDLGFEKDVIQQATVTRTYRSQDLLWKFFLEHHRLNQLPCLINARISERINLCREQEIVFNYFGYMKQLWECWQSDNALRGDFI